MSKTIYLVRHGQPEEGYAKRFLGRLDPDLSPGGARQAERMAGRMAALAPDRCFSSPLRRARRTADIIARACGLPVEENRLLLEIDFGALEGKTFAEAAAIYPGIVDSWQALAEGFGFPGGEDLAEFNRRAERLADLARTCPDERILMVAHGGILRALLCALLGVPSSGPLRFRFAYAALASLELDETGRAVMTGFNVGGDTVAI